MQHYYMEMLAFCALIKHMFKTNLQKDEISYANDLILSHMQTLALKCSQKIMIKSNSSGFKINPIKCRVFGTVERQKDFWPASEKLL